MSKVKIVIRIRPSDYENAQFQVKRGKTYTEERLEVSSRDYDDPVREFMFDKVFEKDSTQEDVAGAVCDPMLENVFSGYHSCIFAYGQTSSGKTHSVFGKDGIPTGSDRGIVPRTLGRLFESVKEKRSEMFQIFVSFFEIYLGQVIDLGVFYFRKAYPHKDIPDKTNLEIRERPDGEIYVEDLVIVPVSTHAEAMEVVKMGVEKRKTYETQANERSSRSHTVFTITVINENEDKFGRINFIDLAGNERYDRAIDGLGQNEEEKKKLRLKEHNYINQSLTTLGKVILGLHNGERHISYRDSKLTRILQNSLGSSANSYTTILTTLNPEFHEECLETLKFAFRCKNVRNAPQVNFIEATMKQKDKLIEKLEGEILKLRKEILEYRKITQSEKLDLNQQIANLLVEKRNWQRMGVRGRSHASGLTVDGAPNPLTRAGSRRFFSENELKKMHEREKKFYEKKIQAVKQQMYHMKNKAREKKNEFHEYKKAQNGVEQDYKKKIHSFISLQNRMKNDISHFELKLEMLKKEKEEDLENRLFQLRDQYEGKILEYKNVLSSIPMYLRSVTGERERDLQFRTEVDSKYQTKYANLLKRSVRDQVTQMKTKEKMYKDIMRDKDNSYKRLKDMHDQHMNDEELHKQKLGREIDILYEYCTKLASIIHKMEVGIYPIQMRFNGMRHIRITDEDLQNIGRKHILRHVMVKLKNTTDFIHEAETYACSKAYLVEQEEQENKKKKKKKRQISFYEMHSRTRKKGASTPFRFKEKKKEDFELLEKLERRNVPSTERYKQLHFNNTKHGKSMLARKSMAFTSTFPGIGMGSTTPGLPVLNSSFGQSTRNMGSPTPLDKTLSRLKEVHVEGVDDTKWKEMFLAEKKRLRDLRIAYYSLKSQLDKLRAHKFEEMKKLTWSPRRRHSKTTKKKKKKKRSGIIPSPNDTGISSLSDILSPSRKFNSVRKSSRNTTTRTEPSFTVNIVPRKSGGSQQNERTPY